MQVFKIVDVRQNPAGGGVVLQIVDHPVNLVEHAFLVLVPDAQLVAVGLADGAVLSHPFVPDMAAQVCDAVRLFLPDPQQLVHGAFPVGAPQGHDGKFLGQVVAVHHAEFFNGMRRCSVLPVGANLQIFVGKAVFQNVPARFLIQLVSIAHVGFLPISVGSIIS